LIDSIVDAFFPFLEEIEKEVGDIEDIVYSEGDRAARSRVKMALSDSTLTAGPTEAGEKPQELEKFDSALEVKVKEGTTEEATSPAKPRFSLFRPSILIFSRQLSVLRGSRTGPSRATGNKSSTRTTSTLRRMARTRRLVTSLTRLLATKSEVVMQIRKRLMSGSHPGLGNGSEKSDDAEVAIYMGDVQGTYICILFLGRIDGMGAWPRRSHHNPAALPGSL
jgi:magnesium transporter